MSVTYKCTWNGTDYPSEGETPGAAAQRLVLSLSCTSIASREQLDGSVVSCDGESWRIKFRDTPEHASNRWFMTFAEVFDTEAMPTKIRELAAAEHDGDLPRFIPAPSGAT